MEKDIYISKYVDKIEELFIKYKSSPNDSTAMDIMHTVFSFINTGHKLPLGYSFYPLYKEPATNIFTPEEIRGEDESTEA